MYAKLSMSNPCKGAFSQHTLHIPKILLPYAQMHGQLHRRQNSAKVSPPPLFFQLTEMGQQSKRDLSEHCFIKKSNALEQQHLY